MTGPVLEAKALRKEIGKRVIVENATFSILPGEVFGFLGPNGAGKTTTIRMLVGLIRPTSGSVTICGHDVGREFEQAMRCVGCIVETPDLYRFMTGRQNLEHFARMRGKVVADEIERVSGLVELSHRLDDRVGTYSLGMRQRLGIAQALLARPRLMILDEPANGLDPAGIREIRTLLRRLASEGVAVFVSSHLLAEIEMMCDRVAIIHRGRILETSGVRELASVTGAFEIEVDDAPRALEIAKLRGFDASIADGLLRVTIEREAVPRLVEALVTRGIRVFAASEQVRTLEEIFLEATGGETV